MPAAWNCCANGHQFVTPLATKRVYIAPLSTLPLAGCPRISHCHTMSTVIRPSSLWKAFFIAALALFLAACNPIAIIEVNPTKVVVNEEVTFDGSGTLINANPEGATAVKYEWDFGDGETANGAEVTHTYTRIGTYKVTLTVTDSAGRKGSATESVNVGASTGNTNNDDETDEEDDEEA